MNWESERHLGFRCGFAEAVGVRDVACGYGFTVFAINNEKGMLSGHYKKEVHLMGTGINKDGQIGKHSISN